MSDGEKSWADLTWIEPQSRLLMKSVFKRDLDVMTPSFRRRVNWSVLIVDVVVVYLLLRLL